jgi:hypothetical protein
VGLRTGLDAEVTKNSINNIVILLIFREVKTFRRNQLPQSSEEKNIRCHSVSDTGLVGYWIYWILIGRNYK